MNAKFFTTLDLPKSQQLDAWRRWFDLFDVQSDAPIGDFRATSETWSFGKFSLSRVKAPRLLASRTAKHIRRDSIDHWNIAIGQKRTLADAGGNRSIDVPAGVPFAAILSGPLERAVATARPLTTARDLPVTLAPERGGVAGHRAAPLVGVRWWGPLPGSGPMGHGSARACNGGRGISAPAGPAARPWRLAAGSRAAGPARKRRAALHLPRRGAIVRAA